MFSHKKCKKFCRKTHIRCSLMAGDKSNFVSSQTVVHRVVDGHYCFRVPLEYVLAQAARTLLHMGICSQRLESVLLQLQDS
eukprot:m.326544 g.326544  ORF g.326544 m.326544 type:complete len:81 (+) comp20408_c0_seq3:98-340(+)